MKIKELQKCVNISWSPGQEKQYQQEIPIMLAAGTAGQQLDASGTSSLEVYAINLDDPSYDMTLKGSQTNPYRFHKIIWSPIGIGGQQYPSGIIVGGCEGGHLQLFNANTIINGGGGGGGGGGGAAEALIAQQDKHTGAVRSLDYNPFQQNLLASGSSESEILIWDLNNVTTPMTPGTKTQPFEDIQNLAWNKQVQHILGSVFSQRCVIWDLRKNEPIIKLTDTQSRVRWHAVQWHPDVATQLWLASEDDVAPIVQLWDLRYATAPTKSIQIHQRGILGLSWCKQDLDLMVSCGKDNRILCWNPNVEQSMIVDEQNGLVSEVASTIQWYSDVIWCPKNPAILASSSLEGMVSVYSVFGGTQQQLQTTNKIADSFPGMETFAQIPVPQNITQITYNDLKQPPKWMKRPIGATFGFGGKLITFQNTNTGISIGGQQQQQQPPQQSVTAPQSSYIVSINQIITEPNLIERSIKLEDVLSKGNFIDYCRYRADQMADQHGRYVWYFLKANFEENTRAEMLNLLGYKSEDMQFKFKKITEQKDINQDVIQLTNKMVDLSRADDNSTINGNRTETPPINLDTTKEIAIDDIPFKINVNDQLEGLICQALITGNVESAVDLCMEAKRYADAIIIAMSGGTELLARTQYRYLKQSKGYLSHIISALVTDDWSGVIQQCTVDSWKEALCAALTHCPINEQMFELCEKLGERLQEQLDNQNRKQSGVSALQNAILCYICAGNIEKLVDAWLQLNRGDDHYDDDVLNADGDGDRSHSSRSILVLQDLVEIIILFQKSMELKGKNVQAIGKTANILSRYAQLLATQGALHSALTYLGPSDDSVIVDLRERLYYALGHKIQQRQQQQHQHQQQQQQPSSIYASGNMFSQRNPSLTNQMPSAMLQSQPHQQQQQQLPGMMYPQQQQQQTTSQLFNTNLPGANIQQKPPQLQPPIVNPWNQNQNILQPSSTTNILQPALSNIGAPPPSVPPPTSNTVMGQQQQQQHQQPPRPSSVSSQSGGGIGNNTSALPKNKYLLDPSVQSNYGGQIQHSYQSPINNQQQQFNQFQPLQQPQPYFNDINQQFKPFSPPSLNNNNYLSGGPPPPPQPIEYTQQGHQFNQMLPPNQQQNQQPQQRNPTPPPGWNDPPAVKTSRHPSAAIKQQQLQQQQQQQDTNNMNAITHPLFGQDPNQMQMNTNNNNGYIYDQNANIQPIEVGQSALPPPPSSSSSSLSSMQARSGSSQSINQTYSNNYQPQQQQQQQQQFQMPRPPSVVQQQQQQRQQASTPIVKEKLPLPEEYVYMQTVFDELRLQCTHTASNAQTKRKLEDVGKRLENLYDLLRENRLTTTTLTSLNQLVQLVQIGDYVNGLGLHTQMISGPDFSQIANFMPGIKVLLQTAMQLQVYLR